ncbi:hypothetical protein MTsN4n12_31660 [Microbacterium sp. MTN4-12]
MTGRVEGVGKGMPAMGDFGRQIRRDTVAASSQCRVAIARPMECPPCSGRLRAPRWSNEWASPLPSYRNATAR